MRHQLLGHGPFCTKSSRGEIFCLTEDMYAVVLELAALEAKKGTEGYYSLPNLQRRDALYEERDSLEARLQSQPESYSKPCLTPQSLDWEKIRFQP